MPATELESPKAAGPLKFAYQGGSRPLAGYTIKRGVGRGGFGEVYYAVSDGGKEVALKLIRRNLDVEVRGVTSCLNLKHPALLAIYDVRQDDEDNTWIIMEYIGGPSLEEVIGRHPNGMPAEDAVRWLRGIGAGVAYLHDNGIVHRDLKPGNIFCDQSYIKLGDYGLAKFMSCSRRSGQTESIGTVHYMAPEISNGRYGKEIDIYALGVILFEMLTGTVPFEGESVGEVLMKHLTASPDVSRLAEPYRTIVSRSLAKDPQVRIGTVEEFLALLPGSGCEAAHQQPPISVPVVPVAVAGSGTDPSYAAASFNEEEPIWRGVKQSFHRLAESWGNLKLGTTGKAILLVLAVAALPAIAAAGAYAAVIILLTYGVYRVVRAALLHWGGSSRSTSPAAAAADRAHFDTAPHPSRPADQYAWRHRQSPRPSPIHVPTRRERTSQWLGSLLSSAAAVALIGLVMVLLRGEPPTPSQFAWLTLTSLSGAWAILTAGHLWQDRQGEPMVRRLLMLAAGLGVGTVAYVLHTWLFVDLPFETTLQEYRFTVLPRDFYNAVDGAPLWFAHIGYFGFWLMMVRWWWQTSPTRTSRLSFWHTGGSVFAAWVLNIFWTFPQPWGLMIAATTSMAVQLASPWRGSRDT